MTLCTALASFFCAVYPNSLPKMSLSEIRSAFLDFEGWSTSRLVRYGDHNFPLYEELLKKSDLNSIELAGVFWIASKIKTSNRVICRHAYDSIVHKDSSVKINAIKYLGFHKEQHAKSAAIALLYDAEIAVGYAAARYLAIVGDNDTYLALKIVLRNENKIRNLQEPKYIKELNLAIDSILIRRLKD